jgi:hypothetical protein
VNRAESDHLIVDDIDEAPRTRHPRPERACSARAGRAASNRFYAELLARRQRNERWMVAWSKSQHADRERHARLWVGMGAS